MSLTSILFILRCYGTMIYTKQQRYIPDMTGKLQDLHYITRGKFSFSDRSLQFCEVQLKLGLQKC
jgi:hypothetical protein